MICSTSDVAVCCSSDSVSSRVRCWIGLEQPHILYRDHRLVGKRRYQLDFALRKRVNARARKSDDANRRTVTHERHANHRASPSNLGVLLFLVEQIGPRIVDPGDLPAHGGAADDCSRPRRNCSSPLDFQVGWIETVAGREAVNSTFQSEDHSPVSATESRCSVHDAL